MNFVANRRYIPGKPEKRLKWVVYGNAIVLAFLALYLFLIPSTTLIEDLREPALTTGATPSFAFRWHRALSPSYETWARQRVASGQAANLSVNDISGTEWPVFGSVFYLWATESLQQGWEQDPTLAPTMPKEYARGAIQAAAALVADPNHAAWVKQHWGASYLQRQDLFYRMLLIGGLTSYQKLTADSRYQTLLSSQVESLSKELDDSPVGLLDDYPGQCYPVDVLFAIAAIRRADTILGTDHSAFVARAQRAFQGARLDDQTGLPTYAANSRTGQGIGPARGVEISMLIWAPELWPDTARQWYARYDEQYWQSGALLAGFREFSRSQPFGDWYVDVDAGPVIAGYGTAASAFGIGAARANGRFDQAYALTAEALVASWPLPDGTLLGPRVLSNLSDAPYVGEAALLFNVTRQSRVANSALPTSGLPFIVYLALAIYIGVGIACLGLAAARIGRYYRRPPQAYYSSPQWQLVVWLALILAGIGAAFFFNAIMGLILCLTAQFLPISQT